MGFLSNVWNKTKQIASSAFGTVGNIAKRVGEVGGAVLRGVGRAAPYIADGLSFAALATGHPEIAGVIQGVSRAIQHIGTLATTGAGYADKLSKGGAMAEQFGNSLRQP